MIPAEFEKVLKEIKKTEALLFKIDEGLKQAHQMMCQVFARSKMLS
jgi:hypothetical protein